MYSRHCLSSLVAAVLMLACFVAVASAASTITSVSPNQFGGFDGATLTITGSGFVSGAVVKWAGTAVPTTFVSATQLTADVPSALNPNCGVYPLTVTNPDGSVSNIYQMYTEPVLFSVNPSSIPAGGPDLAITVGGLGFAPTNYISVNGTALATTYVSVYSLKATVPATMTAQLGSLSVMVKDPSGVASFTETLTITGPVITYISVPWLAGGGPAFTLTVLGKGFTAGASVRINGNAIPTNYVAWTELTAQVPASAVATAGSYPVTVLVPGEPVSNALTLVVDPAPQPVLNITSMSPVSVAAGAAGFTLTVNGNAFVSGSVVKWNGSNLATTFVSGTQLTAQVPASLVASPGTAQVLVSNPGGQVSTGYLTFTITGPTAPTVSSISPTSTTAGGAGFTLAVNGSRFVNGSIVQWDGYNLTTVFNSSASLTAQVPAARIASTETARVTVANPDGEVSNLVTCLVVPAAPPVVSSVTPNSATAGSLGLSLTVYGSGFVSASVVQWNGAALVTTYTGISLTAQVPASLLAAAGAASITVSNAAGGVSNAVPFTVTAGPPPTTSFCSPGQVNAGSPAFTLTVTGANFVSGAKVNWGGDRAGNHLS